MNEVERGKISFPDWNPGDFDVARSWIYAGAVSKLTLENALSVFNIADYLLLESLQDECADMIFESRQKCYPYQILRFLDILSTSIGFRKYQKICHDVVAAKDKAVWLQKDVMTSADASATAIKFLCLSLRIQGVKEESLFMICRNWIDSHSDPKLTEAVKQDVVESVHLDALSLNFLQNALVTSSELSFATVSASLSSSRFTITCTLEELIIAMEKAKAEKSAVWVGQGCQRVYRGLNVMCRFLLQVVEVHSDIWWSDPPVPTPELSLCVHINPENDHTDCKQSFRLQSQILQHTEAQATQKPSVVNTESGAQIAPENFWKACSVHLPAALQPNSSFVDDGKVYGVTSFVPSSLPSWTK